MSVTILPALGGATLTVDMAFGASPDGDPALWSWTDITAYVMVDGIPISRGRSDNAARVEPSKMTLRLINSDGRFTPENTASPYFPNVRMRVPVRVRLQLGATTSTRFTGFVDEWPIVWPGTVQTFSTVTITASSRWRRLAQSPPFRSLAEEVLTYLRPSSYYPMTEGPAALVWSDRSGNNRPDVPIQHWEPGVRDYTSLQGDDQGAIQRKLAAFYPSTLAAPAIGGGAEIFPIAGHSPAGSATFFFYAVSSPAVLTQIVDIQAGTEIWRLAAFPGTGIMLQRSIPSPGPVGSLLFSNVVSINVTPNPIAATFTQSGSNIVIKLWSPVAEATATVPGVVPTFRSVSLNEYTAPAGDVTIGAHLAVFDRALTAAELAELKIVFLQGQFTDTSAGGTPMYYPDRLIRARAWLAGYRNTQITTEGASAFTDYAASDAVLGGKGRIESMQVFADSAMGLLYETLDGGLGFQARTHRYVSSPWLTVDVALDEVRADGFAPTFDDAKLVNDVTVTSRQGRSRYFDQASIDAYGSFEKSITSVSFRSDVGDTNFSLLQHAAWLVNTESTPRVRFPTLAVDLHKRAATAAAWLAGEPIGSRLRVLHAPSQLGPQAATLDVFIEGYTETIGMFLWQVVANCSPVDPYDRLFKLQDTQLGRLDLDGQTLTSAESTTDTSFSVTTAAGKPLLATTGFPFDLDVEGEQVRVTNATGASSPQTVTVTRSINGVVKAHAAGAPLKLWRPGVLKL